MEDDGQGAESREDTRGLNPDTLLGGRSQAFAGLNSATAAGHSRNSIFVDQVIKSGKAFEHFKQKLKLVHLMRIHSIQF